MRASSIYFTGIMSMMVMSVSVAQELTPPLPPRPLPPVAASPVQNAEPVQAPAAQTSTAPGRLAPAPSQQPAQTEVLPLRFTTGQTTLRKAPKTGYYIAGFGGVNFFQDTDGTTRVENPAGSPDPYGDLNTRNRIGGIAGVKFGYDWPFKFDPIDQWAQEVGGEGFRMSGGLEGEAFYAYIPYRGEDPVGKSVSANFHTMNLMGNALLKLQAGNWRPYAGPGLGLVQVFGKDYKVIGQSQKEDTATCLGLQALVGTDYFITDDWSLFAEYRWMMIKDLQVFGSPYTLKFNELQTHFFEFGIKTHF